MSKIEKAGIYVKDGQGNVGHINGLTDNDITKIQSTMQTVKNITTDDGTLPDATTEVKGVVLAADADTDVVQPTTGQQYALTTASTPQFVTVKGAQTISGWKTFSNRTTLSGMTYLTGMIACSGGLACSGTTSFSSRVTATNTAEIMLSNAAGVTVPTTGSLDNSSSAASTAWVTSKLADYATSSSVTDALTNYVGLSSAQTISGSKTFSSVTSFNNLLYAYNDVNIYGNLTIQKNTAGVYFADAKKVTVPTVATATDSSTNAASTAFVQSAIDNKVPDTSSFVTTEDTAQDIAGTKNFTGTLKAATGADRSPSEYYGPYGVFSGTDPNFGHAYDVLSANSLCNWFGIGQEPTYAIAHRNVYRGVSLIENEFATLEDLADAVANRHFENIYIGDYFTVTGTDNKSYTLTVVDICMKDNYDTPMLLLKFDSAESLQMNNTDTTSGGFNASTMWTTTMPALETALITGDSAPLNGMVKQLTITASSTVNSNLVNPCFPELTGVSTHATNSMRYICMLTDVNVFGTKIASMSVYDYPHASLMYQLPYYRLMPAWNNPAYTISPQTFWTCNVTSSTTYAAFMLCDAYLQESIPNAPTRSYTTPFLMAFIGKSKS